MTFDLKRMLESKAALRRKLAERPVAEKLVILEELRERVLAIRTAVEAMSYPGVRESPEKYGAGRDKKKRSKG
ncbi:MAG TPA: hypothetical protein DCS42_09640 [Nitrospiraceae bacterium]|jgi:hypothetical protein|nr:MAG: hypothetical protein A2X57_00365 [Nitrospirae bacterium GWD2_57_8]HAR46930.1 hypothetical protein [Nitrospiraceae bacterium]HAS54358.1 hypothetical protein [Nitrospiraceae bacterium]